MSNSYLNDYLSNLTSQISVSVERLKAKETSKQQKSFELEEPDNSGLTPAASLQSRSCPLLNAALSYQLTAENGGAGQAASSYAAASYQNISEVNRESTVLIDLMFANNREFDFKV